MALGAEGLVDLGENRFQDLRVAARLIEPGAIAPNLSGRDVRLAMVLNGAVRDAGRRLSICAPPARPSTAPPSRACAPRGSARVARRATSSSRSRPAPAGSSASTPSPAGTIANVTLERRARHRRHAAGLRQSDPALRPDRRAPRARLRSFRRPLSRRRPGAGEQLSGQRRRPVRRQHQSRHDQRRRRLRPHGPGRGAQPADRQCHARATCSAAPPTITAGIAMEPVRPDPRRRTSGSPRPALSVTSGGGTYGPTGAIDLRLPGVSRAYGAARRPRHRHRDARRGSRSPRPVPASASAFANVSATVRATAGGWAIQATGESAYGPFSADVVILSGRGPMTIDVNRLTFAGIDFAGRLVQSRAGPFVGTLTMAGQGLSGTVRLARRGPLPAARHRRRRQRRADARRRADHHPARPRPRHHHPLSRRAADRRRRPARRPVAAATCSSSARGSRSTIAAATAPPSCSPKAGAACRSGSPPMPRIAPEHDPRRDAGPGQQHPFPLRPARPRSAATAAAGGWRRRRSRSSRAGSASPAAGATA